MRLKNEITLAKPRYLDLLDECLQEAVTSFNHPRLEEIFNPDTNYVTFNEMPLMYKQEQQAVYGIIDRIIKASIMFLLLTINRIS